jgi:hypothetical protein
LGAESRDCACAEEAEVVEDRALVEGVKLNRLAGGAAVALCFRAPSSLALAEGVFFTGTETVRVLILGGFAVNMLRV